MSLLDHDYDGKTPLPKRPLADIAYRLPEHLAFEQWERAQRTVTVAELERYPVSYRITQHEQFLKLLQVCRQRAKLCDADVEFLHQLGIRYNGWVVPTPIPSYATS